MSSGEGIFAVVVNGGRFEEIGVIENVTTLTSGEISDGDGFGVDLIVGEAPIIGVSFKDSAVTLLLSAELRAVRRMVSSLLLLLWRC